MKALLLLPLLLGQFPDSLIALKTFQVHFTQTTVSPLFPEITDEGDLYVDGCRFRFEYTTHERRVTIGTCDRVFQYTGDEPEPLVFDRKDLAGNPFLDLLSDRQAIRDRFVWEQVGTEPPVYRLVPKRQQADSPFVVLKITMDPTESRPVRIEIIDETEQVTTYTFADFRRNVPLSGSLFHTEVSP